MAGVASAKTRLSRSVSRASLSRLKLEGRVDRLFDQAQLTAAFRQTVEEFLRDELSRALAEIRKQADDIQRETQRLEDERRKLLQLVYADAIPLDLVKSEQQRIGKALEALAARRKTVVQQVGTAEDNLARALDLVRDCAEAYRAATPLMQRLFVQAFFTTILVGEDGQVLGQLSEPFGLILNDDVRDTAVVRVSPVEVQGGSQGPRVQAHVPRVDEVDFAVWEAIWNDNSHEASLVAVGTCPREGQGLNNDYLVEWEKRLANAAAAPPPGVSAPVGERVRARASRPAAAHCASPSRCGSCAHGGSLTGSRRGHVHGAPDAGPARARRLEPLHSP
ncbi:hypothetical protein G9H71_02595 [Motilibacter sp. E257]|uniref:Uncharacterized protein n=2 Tax=Motilibacter deserti TaxID=2714956 RepID=A0ABX0GQA1_9ACTN|nr:hypothetical protein [Motilibacter deserti]